MVLYGFADRLLYARFVTYVALVKGRRMPSSGKCVDRRLPCFCIAVQDGDSGAQARDFCAVAAPIPIAPPVITATLRSNRILMVPLPT
jgi:hypothetical protein